MKTKHHQGLLQELLAHMVVSSLHDNLTTMRLQWIDARHRLYMSSYASKTLTKILCQLTKASCSGQMRRGKIGFILSTISLAHILYKAMHKLIGLSWPDSVTSYLLGNIVMNVLFQASGIPPKAKTSCTASTTSQSRSDVNIS